MPARQPDWPTARACRRSTTATPAGGLSHIGPAADRPGLASCRLSSALPRSDEFLAAEHDSVNETLVSPPGLGRSTGRACEKTAKAGITLTSGILSRAV